MKLAFGASEQYGFVIKGQNTVYTGDISEIDGAVTWSPGTPVLDAYNSYWSYRYPVRMVNDGTNDITLLLNQYENDMGWCLNRWDGSTNTITRIGPVDNGGWNYRPDHQPFDVGGNGLVVVMYLDSLPDSPYTLLGYKLMVSSDYGLTFGAPIDIDALLSILGESVYRAQDVSVSDYSVQIDPVTGTAYILATVDMDGNYINFRTFLFSSTNGTEWTLVKDFGIDTWYSNTTYLAVRDGKIAAAWNRYDYDTFSDIPQVVNYSDDGGAIWSVSSDVPNSLYPYASRALVFTDSNGFLIYQPSTFGGVGTVHRSDDGGASWLSVLVISSSEFDTRDSEIRSMGDVVALTCNSAILPDVGGVWTDSGGPHTMNVGGSVQLAMWISINGGVIWGGGVQTSPHAPPQAYQSLALMAPSLVPPVPDPIVMPQVNFTINVRLYVDRVTIDPNTGCIPRPAGCKPLSAMTMDARPASSLSQDQIPASSMSKDNAPVSALICEIKQ